MSNQIASLPLPERARLYRQMASETSRLAEEAQVPDAKAMFGRLSHCWKALADELADEAAESEILAAE